MVRNGPPIATGWITALTREPSGRRASTIGDASSMRRPTSLDDLVDRAAQVVLVDELDVGALDLAAALDVDGLRAVAP